MNFGAVGTGADLVGNADAAFTGEAGGEAQVDSWDGASRTLQALADGLTVGRGRSLAVEVLNPAAARWRKNPSSQV